MTLPAFDLEDSVDYPESIPGTAPVPDYSEWLARGRDLAQNHSGHQWSLGDWLLEGEGFDIGSIPGYLLIHKKNVSDDGTNQFASTKAPNYWRDASAEVGIPTPTLREYAYTARAWPKKKRFKQLSYTHHSYAAPYERREEYLRACLVEGEKPHCIDWLWKYIRIEEGEQKEIESEKYLRFMIPEDMWAKLKNLGKWYGTPIPDLVQKACVDTVGQYLEEQARKVSLDRYGMYEGRWPFYEPTEFNKVEKKKANKKKKTLKRKRQLNDTTFSEKQRQGSLKAWQSRRDRMKPVTIRRIA